MRHAEQSVLAVRHAPFDDAAKMDILDIIDEYVFGHVHRETELVSHGEFSGGKPSPALLAFTREQFATGEYPNLQELFGDFETGWEVYTARRASDRFERGLAAVIAGLERTLPRVRGRRRPRR
jgi:hypothetical protein